MPSVPDYIVRKLEPRQDGNLRLASQANVAKPQACQACQQRKRKCDRKRPSCSMCEKRKIECVFDIKITDRSHPNFLTNLLKSLEEKDQRIKALEELIQSRLPDLSSISSLSVDEISSYAPSTSLVQVVSDTESSPPPVLAPPPLVAGTGSPPMSPALVASVAQRLLNVDLTWIIPKQPSVVSFMHSQLGGSDDGDADNLNADTTNVASWPPYELAVQVAKVFVESNAMYPIFRLTDLLSNLEYIYQPHADVPGDPDDRATPLQTYTLFLVFALGFVWLARRINGERIDTSLLRNRALSCLGTVLQTEPGVTCVSSLFLLSFWSVFDSGGPDNVQLCLIISELSLEFGLHMEPPVDLDEEEKDRRRILFWAIYAQERALAGVLSTPVLLLDKDITVSVPTSMDAIGSLAEGIDPIAFYRHNIAMRRLFWTVNTYVHGPDPSVEDRIVLLARLDEWYDDTPRPPPPRHTSRDGYFDLYYHTIRANLYRPRAFTHLPAEHLAILKDSASTGLSIGMSLYEQRKWVDNYYHLYHAVTLGITLLYSLLLTSRTSPEAMLDPEWRDSVAAAVGRCQAVVGSFCRGWPFARGLSRAFDVLAGRIVTNITGQQAGQPALHQTLPVQPTPAASTTSTATDLLMADNFPVALDFLPPDSDAAWNTWLNGSIGHLTFDYDGGSHEHVPAQTMEVGDAVDFDALMSNIGWIPDWPADIDLGMDVLGQQSTAR